MTNNRDERWKISGVYINYFIYCKRKLWLFSRLLGREQDSELVSIGKLLHEQTMKNAKKEIVFDNIKIDAIEKKQIILEIKKSDKPEEAHEWQLLYYLYYLKEHFGITNMKAYIVYPLQRKRKEIILTKEKEEKLKQIIKEIRAIISQDLPPKPVKIPLCKKCSYKQFCWEA